MGRDFVFAYPSLRQCENDGIDSSTHRSVFERTVQRESPQPTVQAPSGETARPSDDVADKPKPIRFETNLTTVAGRFSMLIKERSS